MLRWCKRRVSATLRAATGPSGLNALLLRARAGGVRGPLSRRPHAGGLDRTGGALPDCPARFRRTRPMILTASGAPRALAAGASRPSWPPAAVINVHQHGPVTMLAPQRRISRISVIRLNPAANCRDSWAPARASAVSSIVCRTPVNPRLRRAGALVSPATSSAKMTFARPGPRQKNGRRSGRSYLPTTRRSIQQLSLPTAVQPAKTPRCALDASPTSRRCWPSREPRRSS